jgi:DNA polymerase III epsilon subunit-like protein
MRTFRTPSLRTLAAELLDQVIQKGTAHGPGHDSVEDATTALRIYKLMADIWERDLVKMEKQQQQRAAARSTKKQKRRAARLRSAEKAERQAKSSKGSNPDTEQRLRSSGSPSSESPKEKQLLENADDSTGTRSVPAFVDVAS